MRVQCEDEPNYDTIVGGERSNMIDIAMKNSSGDGEERKQFREPTDREMSNQFIDVIVKNQFSPPAEKKDQYIKILIII